jgi:hypothetical protein
MKEQNEADFSLSDIQSDPIRLSDYVDWTGLQIREKGSQTLPVAKQSIILAFWTQGVVGNGGFRYFYEQSNDPISSANAFRHIGLHEAGAAIEESMRVFPPGTLEGDYKVRDTWMNGHRNELEEAWDGPEGVIMGLANASPEGYGDLLETQTLKYINEHLGEFEFKCSPGSELF